MRSTDWLRHEWAFEVRAVDFCGFERFQVIAAGHGLGTFDTAERAEAWLAQRRPCCLGELIAQHRILHPPLVTIESQGKRLGRIRPQMWGSYDAIELAATNYRLTILSAKARAAFPAAADPLVIVRRDGP